MFIPSCENITKSFARLGKFGHLKLGVKKTKIVIDLGINQHSLLIKLMTKPNNTLVEIYGCANC